MFIYLTLLKIFLKYTRYGFCLCKSRVENMVTFWYLYIIQCLGATSLKTNLVYRMLPTIGLRNWIMREKITGNSSETVVLYLVPNMNFWFSPNSNLQWEILFKEVTLVMFNQRFKMKWVISEVVEFLQISESSILKMAASFWKLSQTSATDRCETVTFSGRSQLK